MKMIRLSSLRILTIYWILSWQLLLQPQQQEQKPRRRSNFFVVLAFTSSSCSTIRTRNKRSIYNFLLFENPRQQDNKKQDFHLNTAAAATTLVPTIPKTICYARSYNKRNRFDDDYDDDDFDDEEDYDYYYDDEDDDFYEERRRRRRRRKRDSYYDDIGEYKVGQQDSGFNIPSSYGRRDGWRLPEAVSKSLLAGIFVLGVGLGVTVDSAINTDPKDLASRDAIDQAAPNPTLCAKFGASAMAFDQRVFVTFNPFNVYVAQADVKPACVLRDSNVVPILETKHLINTKEVRACKNNMNTWAFVGDLDEVPQLSCVYRSNDAQNEFLSNPKIGIGEDYLDDDRIEAEKALSSGKIIKSDLTEAQKDFIRQRAMGMK